LQELINRHEILRTEFMILDGELVQSIQEEIEVDFEHVSEGGEDEEQWMLAFVKPFDLGKASQLRSKLIKMNDYHLLMIDMHHIISDGMSIGTFINEFTGLYNGKKLESLTHQFKDYSEWMRSRDLTPQKEYWIGEFRGEIPILDLPLDYVRPKEQNFDGAMISLETGKELGHKIKELARQTGTTEYMVFLASAMVLLGKYANGEDVVIGSPISGRTHQDTEKMLGIFINTLAMRGRPERDTSFKQLLEEVKASSLKAYENQEYPIEELIENIDVKRDLSRSPLFDVMLNVQNNESSEFRLDNVSSEYTGVANQVAKFDLTFNIGEAHGNFQIALEYCTALFKKSTAKRILEYYAELLTNLLERPDAKLKEISMVTDAEQRLILEEFNNTHVEYPKDATVVQLFEEQVEKTPNQIAVVFEDEKITYKELNARANALAYKLKELGIKPDDYVVLVTERSVEMIIGICGIIKAGGAYIPIEPTYPIDRIKYMLENVNPKVVITYQAEIETEIPVIDLGEVEIWDEVDENPVHVNQVEDLIYCIYTSGTTGKPKGVMIEHGGVVNLRQSYIHDMELTEKDVLLQFASICFGQSAVEILACLTIGAVVCVAPSSIRSNPKDIETYINKHAVTFTSLTPKLIQELDPIALPSLRFLESGGEAGSLSELKKWIEHCQVTNAYGMTELTLNASFFNIELETELLCIGQPITNTQIYIMNGDMLSGIGVPGELCIAGAGLARGYLNQPELTAEKFTHNPYGNPHSPYGNGRLYRTGDLARWLPDGNIEYLGRIDQQIKIRGFRIEPKEIESQILKLGTVKETVVLAREDETGDKYLCAYLVSEEEILAHELRQYLSTVLPNYMIPSYFVRLEKIPLTSNGKLDRKALPMPDVEGSVGYTAPRNPTEEILVQVWCEILGHKKIGIYDNFFDLGGHSLKAAIVINKMNIELDINIPLAELYANLCIADIAEYISSMKEDEFDNVDGVLLLKKGKKINKNFFMVHAGHGKGEAYMKLSNHMSDEFNYWGINYENPTSYDPCVMPMENLAARYIKKIKKIQEKGSYYISGWCIGGVIAFEMAKQLETAGDKVKFVGLYNSPAMDRETKLLTGFTLKNELDIMQVLFQDCHFSKRYDNVKSVEVLWNQVVEDLESAVLNDDKVKEKVYNQVCMVLPLVKNVVKDHTQTEIGEIIHYFNLLRGLGNINGQYDLKGKINAKMSYFIALRAGEHSMHWNRELWKERSHKKVDFHHIDADHFSMFEDDEDVRKLAFALTGVLN